MVTEADALRFAPKIKACPYNGQAEHSLPVFIQAGRRFIGFEPVMPG